MTRKTVLTDRLRDRGFVDQWGFIFFAFTGFLGIVSAKMLGVGAWWVAGGAITFMFAYALVIMRAGTGRLRADQAGDNCYYLGLIYTLASLAYAIATFDPGNTASTIVQGFGIALATTIIGLILRVFFNQGRPDLENVEEETRLEMTDAVVRLKAELGDVVRQMNDFSRVVQQSMLELQQSTTGTIQQFANGAVQELSGVVAVATTTIRDEANDFAQRSKRYNTSFDRLLGKLDQHAEAVGLMREAQELVHATAKSAEQAVTSSSAAIGSLRESAEGARAAATQMHHTMLSVQELTTGLTASVERMQSSLQAIHEESKTRIDELRSAPAREVSEAVQALIQATDVLKGRVSEADSLHATVHASIAARSETSLEVTKRHNDELEAELSRSRGLVGKVHSSLAEMTSRLADAVERAA